MFRNYAGTESDLQQEICVSYHSLHTVRAYEKPSIPYTANVDNIQPGLHHSCHKEWYKIYDLFHTMQYSYRKAPSHLTVLNLSLSPLEDTNHISNVCKQLATVSYRFSFFPSAIRMWNYLLTDIASISCFNKFNMKLQLTIIYNYN